MAESSTDRLRRALSRVQEAPLAELRPRPSGEPPRPSPFQEGLWLQSRLAPEDPVYNVPLVVRFEGPLEPALLGKALQRVIDRHETLRWSFVESDGRARVSVARELELRLEVRAASDPDGRTEREELDRTVRELTRGSFSLSEAPLFRALLLRYSPRRHVLVWVWHHILCDQWSQNLLLHELAACYEALRGAGSAEPPEPPVGYSDWVFRQRRSCEGERLERLLEYWRRQLEGEPSPLSLPADRRRPPLRTTRGGSVHSRLGMEEVEALRALAARHGGTLFTALLAVFYLLLFRLTDRRDLVVGVPVSGRISPETEALIGPILNTLPIRLRLEQRWTFSELLVRTREVLYGALEHRELPLERMVEELRPERHPDRSPFFDVVFNFHNVPPPPAALGGCRIKVENPPVGSAKFDLTTTARVLQGKLELEWEYNGDLFDCDRVERWGGHYATLVREIPADPERPAAKIPILTEEERKRVLVDFNSVSVEEGGEASLVDLLESQAELSPEATALVAGDHRLSYRELHGRADRLAHLLAEKGVGRGSVVGVRLERSVELVVALLAVLKAGGAYLPLDPSYPSSRLRFMLEDSGAGILVARGRAGDDLIGDRRRVVDLDAIGEAPSRYPEDPPGCCVGPDQSAYVIYTSGSTGRPKGVAVEHRGPVRLARWAWANFSREELSHVLFSTSICFDLSVFELFVPLAGGAAVVLVRDLLELAEASPTAPVTFLNTVPSAMEELLRLQAAPSGVRVIGLAGEPLTADLACRCRSLPGAPSVWNLYGPTEDTVYSTAFLCREEAGSGGVPIGRPIAGSRVYILDRAGLPLPVGVPGEIFLGGPKLARGYLNRPELTAARFVRRSTLEGRVERLYRTGDRGRFRPDGTIEFLGRLDRQVKVRGFRIEPGEIESALVELPGVREAVVTVDGEGGRRRLLAFWVGDEDSTPGESDLRRRLEARLASYMVPSRFFRLPGLPRTPNGKIDRAALRAPDQPAPVASSPDVSGSPTSRLLEEMFRDLLGVESVGPEASFFELGGHSLLATVLAARVREKLGIPLPLRRVFESPSISSLSAWIDSQGEPAPVSHVEAAPHAGPVGPVAADGERAQEPLSVSQEGVWLFENLHADSAVFNLGYRFRFREGVEESSLRRALETMVDRHRVLRTGFPFRDDLPVAVVEPAGTSSPPIERVTWATGRRGRDEEAVERRIREFVQEPFDLSKPPLMRVLLLEGEGEAQLVLAVHHIAFDGWSRNVFQRELALLYDALERGEKPAPAELPSQYVDFALRQRGVLAGERKRDLLEFWRSRLEGAPEDLNLPLDFDRPPRQDYRGGRESLSLSNQEWEALRRLGAADGATPFMVLLSAFAVLLSRWTDQEDLLIGVPVAGRREERFQDLIGMFVNVLPIRVRLEGDPLFRELIDRVRRTALDAYEHQDLPLETLLRELKVERRTDRPVLFQVALNHQNLPEMKSPSGGDRLTAEGLEIESSRFDLTLYVQAAREGADLVMAYRRSLFRSETIRRLMRRLETLLGSILSDPGRPLSELRVFSEGERRRMEAARNRAGPTQPFRGFPEGETEQSIIGRFRACATRFGDRPALETPDGAWSYRRLLEESERIAGSISPLLSPGDRVALLFDPGRSMIASILAGLTVGAAYVPLDPIHPPERLRSLLEDASPAALLTDGRLAEGLREALPNGLPVIRVDRLPEAEAGAVFKAVPPETPAYLLYTSGSTGAPKGVVQSHRNVLRQMRIYTHSLHLSERDRLSMVAPYTSDMAVMDVFGALLNGASLVPVDLRREGEGRLPGLLEEGRISVLHLTPTIFRWLFSSLPEGRWFTSVRLVVLGGEEADGDDLETFRRRFTPECLLVNGLGPTESSLALQCFFPHDAPARKGSLPVGYPVLDTEVFLVNEAGMPTDWVGEIAIRSRQVALGYWRRPRLTEAAFSNCPSGSRLRIYRTGDRARRLDDGSFLFLGRKDRQVKVRGFRVEPGEIEAVLCGHPSVRRAVAVARKDSLGRSVLDAYVVMEPERQAPQEEVLRYLKCRLPRHMVPDTLTPICAIPRTRHGKLDLGALPSPERLDREAQRPVYPSTPQERRVAEIWKELLGLDSVPARTGFFDLGGDSLTAVRLMGRLERAFHRKLDLATLFEADTVRSQAALLGRPPEERRWSCLVPIRSGGNRPPLFLVHGVGGNILFYRDLVRLLGEEQPVYGIQAAGLDGRGEPPASVDEMAELYLQEIREAFPCGPYFLGGFCIGAYLAHEMACRLEESGRHTWLAVFNTDGEWRTVGSWREDFSYHRRSLAPLRLEDRLRYLLERLTVRLKSARRRRRLRRALAQGRPPSELRTDQVEELLESANLTVQPRLWSGRLLYFEAEGDSGRVPERFWASRAGLGLEKHSIPGRGAGIFRPPHVRVLAHRLRAALEEAVRRLAGDGKPDRKGACGPAAVIPSRSGSSEARRPFERWA